MSALERDQIDWVTCTSSSTARSLVQLLDNPQLLGQVRIASIGPITSRTVRELGFEVAAEADPSDMDGLVAAIVASATGVTGQVPALSASSRAQVDAP